MAHEEQVIKPLFAKGPSLGIRLLVFAVLSAVLMAVDAGRASIMRSATGFVPAEGQHVRESTMCATCHTLYTKALGARNLEEAVV